MALDTEVRDVKKMAAEGCGIEPEHMRLLFKGRELKNSDSLDFYDGEEEEPIRVLFTAGHTAMAGGSRGANQQKNPFTTPVRGIPGSKGLRSSRMSGRLGGMGLIRKYGIPGSKGLRSSRMSGRLGGM